MALLATHKIDGKFRYPPSPPPPQKRKTTTTTKMGSFGFRAAFGGCGFAVPFYSVHDCRCAQTILVPAKYFVAVKKDNRTEWSAISSEIIQGI